MDSSKREYLAAYFECALWSSTDDDGESLDAAHDLSDFNPSTLRKMAKTALRMREHFIRVIGERENPLSEAQMGHDCWLTRNGHGAGFWDRGIGDLGKELTVAAESYGGVDLYIGDDNKIHSPTF